MLKCYKNKTPNNNHLHYYFTDFDDYLTELGTPFAEYELHDYRINENTIILGIAEIHAKDITYFIDIRDNYKRCYSVDFMNYQNGMAIFNVSVDLWASYIADANISNIRVTRCNRNIGVGEYDSIKIDELEGYADIYDSTGQNLINFSADCVVATILYTALKPETNSILTTLQGGSTTESQSAPSVTKIETYMFDLSVVQNWHNHDLNDLIELINGIFASDRYQNGMPAQVISMYLMDSRYVSNYGTQPLIMPTFDSITHYQTTKKTITPTRYINASSVTLNCLIKHNAFLNKNIYIGTLHNHMQLKRLTTDLLINFEFVYKIEGMQVIVKQGSTQYDLTDSFEITLTTNEGVITAQQQTANKISRLSNIISITMGALSKNAFAMSSALIGSASNVNSQIPQSAMGFKHGGNGLSEFSAQITNPLRAITYESDNDERKHARLYGANFNQQIDSLDDIESYSLLGNGSFTESYIKCDAFVDGIPELATNEILSKLNNGIYIKFLPHE